MSMSYLGIPLGRLACLMFALLVISQPASAKAAWSYEQSDLSTADYAVQIIRSDKRLVGCGVSDRHTKPFLFLNILFNGFGSVTVIAPDFNVATSGKVAEFPVAIAGKESTAHAVIDGNVITFDMTKKQVAAARREGMSINEVPIDRARFGKLRKIAAKCLGRSNSP